MSIVREIKYDTTPDNNIDTAFFQGTHAEYDIEGRGEFIDLNGDGDFLDPFEDVPQVAYDVNGDGFISVLDRDTGTVGAIVDGVQLASRGALTEDLDSAEEHRAASVRGPDHRHLGQQQERRRNRHDLGSDA